MIDSFLLAWIAVTLTGVFAMLVIIVLAMGTIGKALEQIERETWARRKPDLLRAMDSVEELYQQGMTSPFNGR